MGSVGVERHHASHDEFCHLSDLKWQAVQHMAQTVGNVVVGIMLLSLSGYNHRQAHLATATRLSTGWTVERTRCLTSWFVGQQSRNSSAVETRTSRCCCCSVWWNRRNLAAEHSDARSTPYIIQNYMVSEHTEENERMLTSRALMLMMKTLIYLGDGPDRLPFITGFARLISR